jgi:hypothetical protein
VLGDIGIVYAEGGHRRLTDTFEKVGTSAWMPPWAMTTARIDEVTPAFWRARRNEVALKILKTTKAPEESYRRFVAEIRILRDLKDEPGVLPILDS